MKTKALVLISGGFDSPVAAHLMQKTGLDLIAIHFSYVPITDNKPEEKTKDACKKLSIKKLYVINIAKPLQEIIKHCQHKYYFVLSKRLMLKIAERIAEKENCKFLITGENLAQVSSQTLPNLAAITKAVKIPVLRPLLTFDKMEIIDIARKIDTFELSKGPEVCDILGPKHPSTNTNAHIMNLQEKNLPLDDLIDQAIKTTKLDILT